jgi:drug/metabolite transporter (DMT)-like permease
LLAWLVLGEALSWLIGVGCCASFAGVLLVARPPFLFTHTAISEGSGDGWSHERALGIGFATGSAVLASGAYLAIRLIGRYVLLWCPD